VVVVKNLTYVNLGESDLGILEDY